MSPSDEFGPAIRRMQRDIADDEADIAARKKMVNVLCGYAGVPPLYQVTEVERSLDVSQLRRDQFFGVPLASAVKEFLKMRGDPKAGGMGAATVNEIFAALQSGGFHFETKNDDNSKRALRISLAKNVAAFRKVPGGAEGAFGLAEWYPSAKAPRIGDGGKQTDPDLVEDQGPPESSDVSTTYHSDDASEPR
ncbi:MAG: hypothetical protein ACKVPY_13175 [Paracoccaceae bacterium]